MPPVNDNLADATVLTGTDGSITADTLDGSTYEAGEPNQRNLGTGAAFEDGSIWYVWQAPADGSFWVNILGSVDASASDIDTYIYLYSAATATPTMADLVYETEDDDYTMPDGSGSLNSGLDAVAVTAGRYYFLQVQSYAGVDLGSVVHVNWSTSGVPGIAPPPPPPPPPPSPGGSVTFNLGTTGLEVAFIVDAVKLTASLFVVVYVRSSDQSLQTVLVTLTGDPADPVAFSGTTQVHGPYTNARDFGLSRIDDTRFLLLYQDDNLGNSYAVVGSVVGGAIVLGSVLTVTASATPRGGSVTAMTKYGVALSPTRAVVCWRDFWASESVVTVLSITGSTLEIIGESRPVGAPQISMPEEFQNYYKGNLVPASSTSFWASVYATDPVDIRDRLMCLITVADDGSITIEPGPVMPMQDVNTPWWTLMGQAIDPTTGHLVVAYYDMRFTPYTAGLAFINPADPSTLTVINSASDAASGPSPTIFSGFAINDSGVLLASSYTYDPAGNQLSTVNTFRLEGYDLPAARVAGTLELTAYARYQDTKGGGLVRQVESWDAPIIPLSGHDFLVIVSVNIFTVH